MARRRTSGSVSSDGSECVSERVAFAGESSEGRDQCIATSRVFIFTSTSHQQFARQSLTWTCLQQGLTPRRTGQQTSTEINKQIEM
jgi:hypothetical protein